MPIVVAVLSLLIAAPPPAPDPASAEAAPRYYHLFALHGRELRDGVREIDVSLDEFATHAARADDPGRPPLTPEEARRLLLDAAPLIEAYSEAARLPAGDLRLDASPDADFAWNDPRRGISLDFLSAVRLLRADAARAWSEGDRATLWKHAATITRMGTHLSAQDASGAAVPQLVGLCIDAGLDLAGRAMDAGAVPDDAGRAELASALAGIPADDPTGVRRWWSGNWRRQLDRARQALQEPDAERAATLHFARLRNSMILSRQVASRLEDLEFDWDLPVQITLFERARAWIIWSYWPGVYDAIESGLIPPVPRAFIENRIANAESLCLRAQQDWAAGAPPDRIAAVLRDARRDSSSLSPSLLAAVPSLRSMDLAVRGRIDEFRARLETAAR